MKKVYITHSHHAFDYKSKLYAPLEKNADFQFIFPHSAENESKDSKELIKNSDFVLAEISYPSTGSGIELGRAESFGIPIVAIFKKGSKPFSSIKFLTKDIIEYEDLEKDFDKIKEVLDK
jgi:hypothetical protein